MRSYGTCRLLDEQQASELIGVTPRALQAWRQKGRGPSYVRISSRCVRYRLSDLNSWIDSHSMKPAAAGGES